MDKSKEVKELQLRNIYSIFFINGVSNLLKINCLSDEHPKNIELIFSTFLVMNFDIFKEVKELQFLNMFSILFTLSVLKSPKFNSFKLEHPWNIEFILITIEESKLNKFTDVNKTHP